MDMLLDDLAQQTFLDLDFHPFENDMGVFHHLDHLGHGKKADEGRDDGDAGRQGFVEDEPSFPGHVAFTDAGQQQAQCAAEKGLLSMAPEERPAMTVMPKTVVQNSSDMGTELHGEFGHGRRKEDQGRAPPRPRR